MKVSILVEGLLPCRRKSRQREEEAEQHVRRASQAAVMARRRLGAVRLIIETAESTERMFDRDGGQHGD